MTEPENPLAVDSLVLKNKIAVHLGGDFIYVIQAVSICMPRPNWPVNRSKEWYTRFAPCESRLKWMKKVAVQLALGLPGMWGQ